MLLLSKNTDSQSTEWIFDQILICDFFDNILESLSF